jgi:hypothetical protein
MRFIPLLFAGAAMHAPPLLLLINFSAPTTLIALLPTFTKQQQQT